MGLQLCYSQWAVNQIKKSTCTNSLFSVLLSWEPLLPLMPRLMPMPTTAITTPPCTTPTPTGPESQLPSHPPPVSAAVARGPLMLRLMPMPTTDTVTVMVIMVDTEVTTDIPMDTDTTIKWRE